MSFNVAGWVLKAAVPSGALIPNASNISQAKSCTGEDDKEMREECERLEMSEEEGTRCKASCGFGCGGLTVGAESAGKGKFERSRAGKP